MTVYFDKTKQKWKAEVWFNNKKFKSKGGFRTKGLAEKYEREALNEIDQMKLTGIQFKDVTYSELFSIWRENAGNRKRHNSLVKDDQLHTQYVEPYLGNILVKDLSSPHFDQVIGNALRSGLTKSSVNKIIQHFKSVFNHAFVSDLIPRNPTKAIKELKFQEKEMDFYYQDELDEFLAHANQKYRGPKRMFFALYLNLFTTGMRLGEVLGLTWQCIDFERDVIFVKQSWNGPQKILEEITKGKKLRVIPLPRALKSELISLRNLSSFRKPVDLVFTQNGTTPIDASNIRKWYWSADADESEVRRIRLHDARHTYGAHFMMNGGSIYKLQKLLGHESITTTERYAHLAPDYLDGVRDMVSVNFSERAEILNIKSSPLPIHSREEEKGFEDAVSV